MWANITQMQLLCISRKPKINIFSFQLNHKSSALVKTDFQSVNFRLPPVSLPWNNFSTIPWERLNAVQETTLTEVKYLSATLHCNQNNLKVTLICQSQKTFVSFDQNEYKMTMPFGQCLVMLIIIKMWHIFLRFFKT